MPIAGRRIAVSFDLNGLMPLEPEIKALTQAALARFEALGCVVEEAFFDVSDLMSIISGTRAYNMVARHADRYDMHRDQMPSALVNQVEGALKVDLRTVTQAERGRTAYWHRVRRLAGALRLHHNARDWRTGFPA